jgi:uncharacterized membrane protein
MYFCHFNGFKSIFGYFGDSWVIFVILVFPMYLGGFVVILVILWVMSLGYSLVANWFVASFLQLTT